MHWPLLAMAALAVGCGNGTTCDPIGTYEPVLVFGGGNCGLVRPEIRTFTIVATDPNGGFTIVGETDETLSGTYRESNGECLVSITATDESALGFLNPVNFSYNMVISPDGDIEGTGMVSTDGCNQVFTVEGRLSTASESEEVTRAQ